MKLWPVLLASLAVICAGEAPASTTLCSAQAWHRYHYGVKARLQFASRPALAAALLDGLRSYNVSGVRNTGAVGSEDPGRRPPLKTAEVFLMSKSDDVTITVGTTSRDDIVRVSVETFSYHCGATEEWRPYWRDFRVFIARWRRA